MIEMRVRRHDLHDLQGVGGQQTCEFVWVSSRIDNDRLARTRVADDVTVTCEGPYGALKEELECHGSVRKLMT
jgi:hypothetical protein